MLLYLKYTKTEKNNQNIKWQIATCFACDYVYHQKVVSFYIQVSCFIISSVPTILTEGPMPIYPRLTVVNVLSHIGISSSVA